MWIGNKVCRSILNTFEPSHTALLCLPYCSTMGKMLPVTMRWALLKLLSISCSVRVIDCSNFSNSSGRDSVRGALLFRDIVLHT